MEYFNFYILLFNYKVPLKLEYYVVRSKQGALSSLKYHFQWVNNVYKYTDYLIGSQVKLLGRFLVEEQHIKIYSGVWLVDIGG